MYFALPHLTLFRCLTFKKEDRNRLLRPFQRISIFCALVFVCICLYLQLYIFGVPPSNPLTPYPCLTFNKEDRDRLPLPIFPETRVLFPNFCQLSTPSHPIKTFELINVICIYLCDIHSYEQSLFPLNSVNQRLLVFSIQSSLQIFYEFFLFLVA